MRSCRTAVVASSALTLLAGCASQEAPPTRAHTADFVISSGAAKACTLKSGGRDVLELTLPVDAEVTARDGLVYLESRERRAQFWLVPGARTINDALARLADVIKDQFRELKITASTDLSVAGAPGRRLDASGVEADDGDPATADIVIFTVGGHVFVTLAHGESLTPASRAWMMELAQSARVPSQPGWQNH